MADDTIPENIFERAMKALMDADPTQALFERTDRGSLRYNGVADQVRAVLEAIREPSEAVRKALKDNIPITGHDWEYNDRIVHDGKVIDDEPGDCWRAMIDATLAEGAK